MKITFKKTHTETDYNQYDIFADGKEVGYMVADKAESFAFGGMKIQAYDVTLYDVEEQKTFEISGEYISHSFNGGLYRVKGYATIPLAKRSIKEYVVASLTPQEVVETKDNEKSVDFAKNDADESLPAVPKQKITAKEIVKYLKNEGYKYFGQSPRAWTGTNIERIYFGNDFATIKDGVVSNNRKGKARALTIGGSVVQVIEEAIKTLTAPPQEKVVLEKIEDKDDQFTIKRGNKNVGLTWFLKDYSGSIFTLRGLLFAGPQKDFKIDGFYRDTTPPPRGLTVSELYGTNCGVHIMGEFKNLASAKVALKAWVLGASNV